MSGEPSFGYTPHDHADVLREIADDSPLNDDDVRYVLAAADEIERLRAQVADLPRYEALVAELREWRAGAFMMSNDLLADAIAEKLVRHGFGES